MRRNTGVAIVRKRFIYFLNRRPVRYWHIVTYVSKISRRHTKDVISISVFDYNLLFSTFCFQREGALRSLDVICPPTNCETLRCFGYKAVRKVRSNKSDSIRRHMLSVLYSIPQILSDDPDFFLSMAQPCVEESLLATSKPCRNNIQGLIKTETALNRKIAWHWRRTQRWLLTPHL